MTKHLRFPLACLLTGLLVPVLFLWAGPSETTEEDFFDSSAKQGQKITDQPSSKKQDRWTILLYGNGDNNLSVSLIEDLLKIETVGSSKTFRIIAEVDFDASREEENTQSGLPQEFSYGVTRFLLEPSDDPERITSRPVQRLPELNLDDPQVLFDFLDWGFKKYPADHYALIFWDHGGQWHGFGGDTQDDTDDEPKRMSLEGMTGPIRRAMADHKIRQFDFIAFDTCLMAGMEVIDAFDGLCHYFLANPEVDFGDGWNYGPALEWLKSHPNAPMDRFVQDEVKAWTDLHMDNGKDDDLTQAAHSAIDMTKYPLVKRKFEAFCQALTAECSPENLILPKMRRMTPEYGADSDSVPGESSKFIDLGNFAAGFAQSKEVSPHLRQRAEDLAASIDAMITAKILGVDKFGASGLSIWYPVFHQDGNYDEEYPAGEDFNDEYIADEYIADDYIDDDYADDEYLADEYDSDYDEDDAGDDWTDEISLEEKIEESFDDYYRLSLFRDSSLWPDYLKKVSIARENFDEDELMVFADSAYNNLLPGETFSTQITIDESAGAFQLHGVLLARTAKTVKRYAVLGEVITADLNGSGTYPLQWKPVLAYLCGDGGQSVPLSMYPKNSIGNYWYAYADYRETPKARPEEIQMLIRIRGGQARLLSVLQDGEGLSPAVMRLSPGGIINPVYWNEVRKGNDPDLWRGAYLAAKESVLIPSDGVKGLSIQIKPLPPGNYSLEFEVENVNAERSGPMEIPLKINTDPSEQAE